MGVLTVIKRDAAETDGAYTLVDRTAPAGYETPYHVHRREDELFGSVGEPAPRLATPPPAEPDPAALAEAAAECGLERLGPLPA